MIPATIILLLIALLVAAGLGVRSAFNRAWDWFLLAVALVAFFLAQLAAAGARIG